MSMEQMFAVTTLGSFAMGVILGCGFTYLAMRINKKLDK